MYVKYLFFLTYTSVFFVVNIYMHIYIHRDLFIYIIIYRTFYLRVSNHILFVLGKFTVSSLSNSMFIETTVDFISTNVGI
jgi:hypothetical protein